MLEEVIVVLLIILIFLLSCDSGFLSSIKSYLLSAKSGFVGEIKQYDDPLTSHKDHFTVREDPHTWEPSIEDFDVPSEQLYRSYAEDLNANVDQAIIESHSDYIADSDFLASTGSSHASARDDFNPAVQFVGLPRKALYANVGAEMNSRTSQSETPEAVMDIREHNSGGYKL